MANRQYIGARYVPKFYEGSNGDNWESGVTYDPLTIVQYLNESFTSKIPVPNTVGDPAHNPKYWAHTGAYNAQVEQYRQQVLSLTENFEILEDDYSEFKDKVETHITSTFYNVREYAEQNDKINDGGDVIFDTELRDAILDDMPDYGGTIYFPCGVYHMYNSLTLTDKRCDIFFDNNARLICEFTSFGHMILVEHTSATVHNRPMRIYGSGILDMNAKSIYGISINRLAQVGCQIEDLYIINCGHNDGARGIHIAGDTHQSSQIYIDNVDVMGVSSNMNSIGIYSAPVDINITNCRLYLLRYGLYFQGGSEGSWVDNVHIWADKGTDPTWTHWEDTCAIWCPNGNFNGGFIYADNTAILIHGSYHAYRMVTALVGCPEYHPTNVQLLKDGDRVGIFTINDLILWGSTKIKPIDDFPESFRVGCDERSLEFLADTNIRNNFFNPVCNNKLPHVIPPYSITAQNAKCLYLGRWERASYGLDIVKIIGTREEFMVVLTETQNLLYHMYQTTQAQPTFYIKRSGTDVDLYVKFPNDFVDEYKVEYLTGLIHWDAVWAHSRPVFDWFMTDDVPTGLTQLSEMSVTWGSGIASGGRDVKFDVNDGWVNIYLDFSIPVDGSVTDIGTANVHGTQGYAFTITNVSDGTVVGGSFDSSGHITARSPLTYSEYTCVIKFRIY